MEESMEMVGDHRNDAGNGATQGDATISRAAEEMNRGGRERRMYELSHVYSDRMPQSPFAERISVTYNPTDYIASHAGNGEVMTGQLGSQGTKMDALGHFGYRDSNGQVAYYGGLKQADVKPTDESPLLRLGIDEVPPIITSGVLLDATRLKGRSMTAGEQLTAADLQTMIEKQRLRDLLPGDALFIHTGWEEKWLDENPDPASTEYYRAGPGISHDAALYIAEKEIVCVGMDVPFIDAVCDGFLEGAAKAPSDAPAELPFFVHHQNLTQAGIYQIHNLSLAELAADKVYLSATIILPLRIKGAAHSAVRPVAIGRPHVPSAG
ncbi:cyclase family protein [Streptomyces sp. NPDC006923]|uniref:cyclase family protein n=1 Tax=Streptomyces sp. NPDC006923 TaxID=3155355 RepID=UPI0033D45B15